MASPLMFYQQDPKYANRRRFGQGLLTQGSQTTPVQHPTQALARLAQGLMGGYMTGKVNDDIDAKRQEDREKMAAALKALSTPQTVRPPQVIQDPADYTPEDLAAGQGGASIQPPQLEGQNPIEGFATALQGSPRYGDMAATALLGRAQSQEKAKIAQAQKMWEWQNAPYNVKEGEKRYGPGNQLIASGGDKLTTAQKNARAAYPGDPAAQQEAIRKHMTKPLVDQREGDPLFKSDIKYLEEQQKAVGAEQRDLVPRVRIALRILESGKAATGFGEEQKLQLRRIGRAMGFDTDGVAESELLQSVTNYLIPRMRVVGSGSTSDKEMASFAKSTVRMQGTTEGNKMIARTYLQIAAHNKKRLNFAREFLRKNRRGATGDEIDQAVGSVFPDISSMSPADQQKIKPGTIVFAVDANGQNNFFIARRKTTP